MASGYNKVLLMGNLTRDVELRHLPNSSTAVASFGIAVNRRFRTADGENREEVTFVDCDAWGKTAELLSQYLRKGRPVFIEGRLKLDTWKDKDDGGNRSKLKVVVEDFRFVDSKEGGAAGAESRMPAGAARSARGQSSGDPSQVGGFEHVSEEEIPF